jgi:hypothetical protein
MEIARHFARHFALTLLPDRHKLIWVSKSLGGQEYGRVLFRALRLFY